MFDAHCHLQLRDFDGCRDAVLSRTWAAGISGILSLGVSAADWQANLRLAETDVRIHAGIGIHPFALREIENLSDLSKALERLDSLFADKTAERLEFVGECGLDARLSEDVSLNRQIAALEAQLAIAEKHSLPLSIHCVRAHTELTAALRHFEKVRGILHAFSGSLEEAMELLKWGDFSFSFGGILTFPSKKRSRLLRSLPTDRILAETDAPDGPPFAPQPVNPEISGVQTQSHAASQAKEHPESAPIEPFRLPEAVRAIAEIRGETESFWKERTSSNMRRFLKDVSERPLPCPPSRSLPPLS